MSTRPTAAPGPQWRFARPWVLTRNVLVNLLIVLIFHEFLVRVLGTVYLPAVTGFSVSAIYFVEGSALGLMALGIWRCIADPPYRQRFRPSFVYGLVAWTFVCVAFLSLNVTSIGGALTVRSLLYAPYLFFLGYLVGVDRWAVFKTLLVTGLVNFSITAILGLLFFEQYEMFLLLFDQALPPGSERLYDLVYRHVDVVLPTGLIVYRLRFRTFFILLGALSLFFALRTPSKRWRAAGWTSSLASLAMVIGTFSRSGIVSAAAIYLAIAGHWLISSGRISALRLKARYAAVVLALIVIVAGGITGMYLWMMSKDINLLDTHSLLDLQGGRLGQWVYLTENLTREGGWLTGLPQRAWSYTGKGKERIWSEIAYFTVDNQYLHIVLSGGLLALLGYLGFLITAMREFHRWRIYPEFIILVIALLFEANLETGSLLPPLVMLIAGGRLADLAGSTWQPEPPQPFRIE
jgi:hypothetical protein